jgi:hypothetical protein
MKIKVNLSGYFYIYALFILLIGVSPSTSLGKTVDDG